MSRENQLPSSLEGSRRFAPGVWTGGRISGCFPLSAVTAGATSPRTDGRSSLSTYCFVWEGLHPFYVQGYAQRLLIFYFFSVLRSVPSPAFLLLPPQLVLCSLCVSDLAAQGAPWCACRAQALAALALQGSSPREFAHLTVPSPSLSLNSGPFTELPSVPKGI